MSNISASSRHNPPLALLFQDLRFARAVAAYFTLTDHDIIQSAAVRPFVATYLRTPVPASALPWDHPDVVALAIPYDLALTTLSCALSSPVETLPPGIRQHLIDTCHADQRPSMERLRASAWIIGIHEAWTTIIDSWDDSMVRTFATGLPPARHPSSGSDIADMLRQWQDRYLATNAPLFGYRALIDPHWADDFLAHAGLDDLVLATQSCSPAVWNLLSDAQRSRIIAELSYSPEGCAVLMQREPWDERWLPYLTSSPHAAASALHAWLSFIDPPPLTPLQWVDIIDSACADFQERKRILSALTPRQWNAWDALIRAHVRRVATADDETLGCAAAALVTDQELASHVWERPDALVRYCATVSWTSWNTLPESHRQEWITATSCTPLAAAWGFRLTGQRRDVDSLIISDRLACLAAIIAIAGHPPSIEMSAGERMEIFLWYMGRLIDLVRAQAVHATEPFSLLSHEGVIRFVMQPPELEYAHGRLSLALVDGIGKAHG